MQVVKPGTTVITKIGEIKAIITGVTITENSVEYRLSYFIQGEYRQIWLHRYEFEIDTSEKGTAGLKDFNKPQSDQQFLITM